MAAESDLLHEFNEFGVSPGTEAIEKCLELMCRYGVTAENFVECWLGYSTTKLNGDCPTKENLHTFDKEVLSREKFASKKPAAADSPIIHNITTINQLYFHEKNGLGAVFCFLFEQILDIASTVASKLQIEDFSPNNKLQSEPFYTIGRICCDAASGSRLNASSLLLEGAREHSSGQCVLLDVSQVNEYSFFPGQVAAVNGTNPTGKKVVVSSLITPPITPTPKTDADLPVPMNVMVACGPFSLQDDLDFTPMRDLIERIENVQPHLVILLGPFLDARNKKIENAELDRTYQEEFDLFLDKLRPEIPSQVHVIIVPSWRDIHHLTVYPTPPFQPKKTQPNFHFFSDPCILNVNGVYIGLTSTDILFHLSKEEIAVAPQGSDRLGRCVSHLFSQRSFYPLHPPSEEMSVDLNRAEDYCKLPFVPHILLVPSDLHYFIKNVQGCVAINPERIVKGLSGGTFARLQVTGAASSVQVKAEIVRI
nr:EOG090X07VJ [Ilyocryptus agilis]